ncbi:cysteine desulfurase [Tenacibaculum sp. SZ-18]|uniref:cysteine desulfurase family protein n=1 Tax=Tenacibaculum sp. SZ-18 TaxID=754423 RepID=UPI000C2D549D|nr:cysteine desulfurase family protein [Tenacibaculum sp. SZ-18]AUC14496.1 cysteine desulfurase [Tenacibaculum sp. SZ-18]
MKQVYLDHAATTYIYDEVVEVMMESMKSNYGNPSSTHQYGRKAKVAIETSRKNIARLIGCSSTEIIFTSSGTEGNNLILNNAVENLGVKTIITSKIEHHAVLNVVENLRQKNGVDVRFVDLDEAGNIDLEELESLLSKINDKVLVTLMMVNNEIGNILEYEKVGSLCSKYEALFHTDAVQAIGCIPVDLNEFNVDFLVASGHKFHGPKGVGFVFVKKDHVVKPMILGGNQEKGVRSSTENVHSIIGMEKALDLAVSVMTDSTEKIMKLKSYFVQKLTDNFKGIKFNGNSEGGNNGVPKILSVRFTKQHKMLLFGLDLKGIAVSSGSACQSGGLKVSHVLKEFLNEEELQKTSIRFSFSDSVSFDELDYVIDSLNSIY